MTDQFVDRLRLLQERSRVLGDTKATESLSLILETYDQHQNLIPVNWTDAFRCLQLAETAAATTKYHQAAAIASCKEQLRSVIDRHSCTNNKEE